VKKERDYLFSSKERRFLMGLLLQVIGVLVLSALVFFGMLYIKQHFFDKKGKEK
jgi:hypothetical protein